MKIIKLLVLLLVSTHAFSDGSTKLPSLGQPASHDCQKVASKARTCAMAEYFTMTTKSEGGTSVVFRIEPDSQYCRYFTGVYLQCELSYLRAEVKRLKDKLGSN